MLPLRNDGWHINTGVPSSILICSESTRNGIAKTVLGFAKSENALVLCDDRALLRIYCCDKWRLGVAFHVTGTGELQQVGASSSYH